MALNGCVLLLLVCIGVAIGIGIGMRLLTCNKHTHTSTHIRTGAQEATWAGHGWDMCTMANSGQLVLFAH